MVKIYLFLGVLIISIANIIAQDHVKNPVSRKGATPLITHDSSFIISSTRAVIVGISDYQSPQIPDLQFADRDAKAFADWLKSPAGGKVNAENIILLTNDSATTARFTDALYWLTENSKEGDLAIIYFSGHGDVETKIHNQSGFLLCYDSPARNYLSGSLQIENLQQFISTLSIDNKVNVLVITDACHAGKLAGSKINGSSLTNANLAQQFAKEVKILSCQTNEFSLEGKEWGQGRGVFSWYLIDGLNGMADANEDHKISLMEIGRYLEEKVPKETAPHQQIPITVGDRASVVANVDENFKYEIETKKSKEVTAFTSVNMRGMESGFLTDSIVEKKYKQFLNAIDEHHLMSPKNICANDLYEELIKEKSLEPLHNLMRRNLAIALQNEIQQVLNAILEDDPYETNNWYAHPEKYIEYPAYLNRAIQLLGEKHYAINSLNSKRLFFEAYLAIKIIGSRNTNVGIKDSLSNLAKIKLLKAMQLEPNAAYLYNGMAKLYGGLSPCKTDSLVFWNQKAVELAPNWLNPLFESGMEFLYCENNACKAESWIEKAYLERPDSYLALKYLSWLRQWQGRIEESKSITNKMILLKPELYNAYATMAYTLSRIEGDYKNADSFAIKAMSLEHGIALDDGYWDELIKSGQFIKAKFLINSLLNTGQPFELVQLSSYMAEACYYLKEYDKGLKCLDSIFQFYHYSTAYYNVRMKFWQARIYLSQGKIQKAKASFNEMFEMDKTPDALFIAAWSWLAECNLLEKKFIEAEINFQKAISYKYCGDGMDAPEPREEAYYLYARFLIDQNRMKEAKELLIKAINERRMGYWGEYGMAIYFAHLHQNEDALQFLEKALENSFPFLDKINDEADFQELKKNPTFNKMMKKYFLSK